MGKQKKLIFILLAVFMSIFCCGDKHEQNLPEIGLMQGQHAPDFTLKSLNGEEFSLSSFQNKSAVYLVFWATWCPYCRTEIPMLKEIHNKYSSKGLKILAIDIAANDPLARVRSFQEKFELPYTILYDEQNIVSREYGILGVPTTILVDINGKIRYRSNVAPINLESYLEKLT